ncbi:uncharacterized protein [Miscanthus floridulus]|uniref:uncharacterized protein isoform X5 n=1 Tax=Miscanthus floridulus TaxID=154761 RepID=UPI003459FF78
MDGQNSFEDKSKDIMEMETEESYGMILNVVLKWIGNKYFLSLCQCVTQSYRVTSTIPLSSACICLLLRQSVYTSQNTLGVPQNWAVLLCCSMIDVI